VVHAEHLDGVERRRQQLAELAGIQLTVVEDVARWERVAVGSAQHQQATRAQHPGALGHEAGLVPQVLDRLQAHENVDGVVS
jgi:hypothetical protein